MPIATAIRPSRGVTRPRGAAQADVIALLRAMRNRVLSNPTLAVGAPNTSIAYIAFDHMIDGVTYTRAAGAGAVLTGQGLINTAAGQFCKLRMEITAAGTIAYSQGGFAGTQEDARIPPRQPSRTTLGLIEIPATFTFGTTPVTVGMLFSGDPDLNVQALD